jgi:hypothetical protein
MKKIFLTILFSIILIFPIAVLAQVNIGVGEGGYLGKAGQAAGYDPNTSETTFSSTLGLVVRMLLSFSGVIFMSLTVYAGFLWMTARGEEAKVEKAQSILRASIIGLIITVGAYSITNFVVPRILERTTGSGPSYEIGT